MSFLFLVDPVKDKHMLEIIWSFPSMMPHYRWAMEIACNDEGFLNFLNMHLQILGLDIEIHVSRQMFALFFQHIVYTCIIERIILVLSLKEETIVISGLFSWPWGWRQFVGLPKKQVRSPKEGGGWRERERERIILALDWHVFHLCHRYFATEVESGHSYNGFELNTTATQFVVNLTLTDQGLDQFEEVLLAVFQYIYMLQAKGVQKQYFDEMKTIEETKFRFKEKVHVLSTINHNWKPTVGVCCPTIEI